MLSNGSLKNLKTSLLPQLESIHLLLCQGCYRLVKASHQVTETLWTKVVNINMSVCTATAVTGKVGGRALHYFKFVLEIQVTFP